MKGTKTSLFLVEMMISLLLFAFCAAICIQIFNVAGQRTRRSEALSKGVFRATQAAEIFKAEGGDMDSVESSYNVINGNRVVFPWDSSLSAYFNENWQFTHNPGADSQSTSDAKYEVRITDIGDGVAEIAVYDLKEATSLVSSLNTAAPYFSIEVKAVA